MWRCGEQGLKIARQRPSIFWSAIFTWLKIARPCEPLDTAHFRVEKILQHTPYYIYILIALPKATTTVFVFGSVCQFAA